MWCSSNVSNTLASAAEVSELCSLKPMCPTCNSQAGFLPTDFNSFRSLERRMELCARLHGPTNDERAAGISRLQWRVSQAASKLRMTSFVLEGISFHRILTRGAKWQQFAVRLIEGRIVPNYWRNKLSRFLLYADSEKLNVRPAYHPVWFQCHSTNNCWTKLCFLFIHLFTALSVIQNNVQM